MPTMSTRLPGLGLFAGLSTSFWKIHGWLDRHGLRRRTTGRASFIAAFYAAPRTRLLRTRLASAAFVAIARHMHLPMPEPVADSPRQRADDRLRLQRALTASLAFVLVLTVAFAAQQAFDWRALAIAP